MFCCRCPSPSDLPPKAAVAYRILDHTETLRSKGTTQQNRDCVQGDIEVLLGLGLGEGPRKQLGRSQVQTVRGAVDSLWHETFAARASVGFNRQSRAWARKLRAGRCAFWELAGSG